MGRPMVRELRLEDDRTTMPEACEDPQELPSWLPKGNTRAGSLY